VHAPTDPAHLSVHVSWDRSDPEAVAHQVRRNGRVVATVRLSADPWDDYSFRDTTVVAGGTYRYRVQPVNDHGVAGPQSRPYTVRVRSDAQIGGGRVFRVARTRGTDPDRARAAVNAARKDGGGVVLFGPRTYRFSSYLLISATDEVVLRGAGAGERSSHRASKALARHVGVGGR
jgi:hypothetical protein